ncbi:hypothetical protein C8F04DRAFT_1116576 [Mycena alexandri]|uniref:Uncharacterized protein n=1 Tax=Mycena alexandri TaxID=1745969 RepID=A0AAD6SL89_9AGAR|nr:hypothetical protein C8F04DRAFT_1116576 [Mycena alexandri]
MAAPQAILCACGTTVGLNSHSAHVHLRTRIRIPESALPAGAASPRALGSLHPSLALPSLPSHPSAHSEADAMPVCVRARVPSVSSPSARGDGVKCGAGFLDVQAGVVRGWAESARTLSCAGILRVPFHSLFSSSPPSLPHLVSESDFSNTYRNSTVRISIAQA